MRFEIKLQDSPSAYFLLNAGLDVDDLLDLWHDVEIYRKRKLPTKLSGEYFNSDPPAPVKVNVLAFNPTHLEIDAPERVAKELRKSLTRWSLENDGKALADRQHKELWAKINKILKRDKLSYDKLLHKAELTPRAIKSLIQLADNDHTTQWNIYRLFDKHSVPKSERSAVANWLIDLFERVRDPREEIGIPLDDLASREHANDLLRLIRNRKLGDRRWVLCTTLARTKHPQATDAIAALLGQGDNTRAALEALARLPAHKHIEKIRTFLRDSDYDVRRQAKKTLQKLGALSDACTPPLPVHLVKGKRAMPKGLAEWSSNLDMNELVPTLNNLAKQTKSGFAGIEIAEIEGVAESMKPDQTRVFRFPITIASNKKTDLWIVIFMDDVDSPDLEIHSDAALIAKLSEG